MATVNEERKASKTVRKQSVPRASLEPLSADTKWSNLIVSPKDQYELKRRAAVAQALRAFGRKGFKNTSLDAIAEALNVSKPALYYYFKDKQELLFECHKLSMEVGDRALQSALEAGGSGFAKMARFVGNYIESLTGELGAAAVLDELDALKPDDRRTVLKRRRLFDRQLRELVEAGIADGSIRACDSKFVVFWFMGAIHGIPSWYRHEGELSGSAIADRFVDFLRQGVQR